jgi:ABC-type glycerol-3-phosphate transport system permease component
VRVIPGWIAHGGAVVWTIVSIIPFVVMILLSFRNNVDIYAHPLGVGGHYHLENYSSAWSGPPGGAGMAVYTRNTAITAFAGLLIVFTVGTFAGYFVTKLPIRMRRACIVFLIACSVMPLALVLVPMFQIYDHLSLLSNPTALGVSYGALALPTAILVLQAHFIDFPNELAEAAALDGLGEFRTFLKIALPLSTGPCIAIGMLSLIFIWGEAQLGIVLLQDATSQTISVGLLGYRGQWTTDLGPQYAGLTIGTVPLIVAYLLLNRYVTKGIALGGVTK